MPLVTSGVETGSLRQLALQRLADLAGFGGKRSWVGIELSRHPHARGGNSGDSQEDSAHEGTCVGMRVIPRWN